MHRLKWITCLTALALALLWSLPTGSIAQGRGDSPDGVWRESDPAAAPSPGSGVEIGPLASYRLFSLEWEFPADFKSLLSVELYKAGHHIYRNLEAVGLGFNTNHYLANLVGLLFLGELFKVFLARLAFP